MEAAKLRIDHLAFPSFDAGETYRFYTTVMRFRLKFAWDGESEEWGNKRYLIIAFAFTGGEIHFFAVEGMQRPKADGLPKDIRHVALSVASDGEIAAWKRRLKRHAVSYWVEDHDGSPSIYFSDPNGVMFEITYHQPEPFDERVAAEANAVVRRWTAAPALSRSARSARRRPGAPRR